MRLTPVIAALRARCPRFENRVGGAAQFKAIPDAGKLKLPAAYVVPSEDVTGEQKSQTDYWQDLTEGFSVIVVLSNERDEKGQWASYDAVHVFVMRSGRLFLAGRPILTPMRSLMPVVCCWS